MTPAAWIILDRRLDFGCPFTSYYLTLTIPSQRYMLLQATAFALVTVR